MVMNMMRYDDAFVDPLSFDDGSDVDCLDGLSGGPIAGASPLATFGSLGGGLTALLGS